MLSEAHYSAALNYFFFLLTDEAMALSAAYKAIKQAQKHLKKHPGSDPDKLVIGAVHAVLEKYHGKSNDLFSPPPESNWRVPDRESMSIWREHVRKLDIHSAEALVLRFILGFKPELIAAALDVPEGTVFYRLGKGLEIFSQFAPLQGARR